MSKVDWSEFKEVTPGQVDWSEFKEVSPKEAGVMDIPKQSTNSLQDMLINAIFGRGTLGAAQGLSKDIQQSASQLPGNLSSMVSQIPGALKEAGGQAISDPLRTLKNLGIGGVEGLASLPNLPGNVANYFQGKGMPIASPLPEIPVEKIESKLGIQPQNQADIIQRGLASFAPYGAVAKGLKLPQRMGVYGAAAAGEGQDPLTGAILGGASEGAMQGLIKGAQLPGKLRPSKMFRGTLTPEQLAANLEQTAGTTTSLDQIIQSPTMQSFMQNIAPEIPFSKAAETMQQTARQVVEKGENILKKLQGDNSPEDLGLALQQALNDAYHDVLKVKNENFSKVNELAAENNVKTDRSNLRKAAIAELNKIKNDPDLAQFRDAKDIKLLKNIAEGGRERGRVSLATGEPLKKGDFNLRETDFLRSELGEQAQSAWANNELPKAKLYGDLKAALEKDVNKAIDDSGIGELKSARDTAMKHYREEVAQFEDNDINKFIRKGGDPDLLLNTFLKTSRVSDRGNLLDKLVTKLPKSQQNLVPLAYYSRALEESSLNPNKLKTLHKNLGDKQKNALLKDKALKKELDNYSELVKKNEEPLSIMANPKTGQRGLAMIKGAIPMAGYAAAGVPGLIAGATLPGFAIRPLIKALTSPNVREKLVGKMIQDSKKIKADNSQISELARLLAAGSAQQNKDK